MKNENINIPEYISKLREIKKDELTEREFYEKVLEQIAQAEKLTPETHELLKETLAEVGCGKYSDWKEEKEAQGKKVDDLSIGEGVDKAYIGTAVSMIAQYFAKYESAISSQERMQDWIEDWLENSKKIYGKEIEITNNKSKNNLNIPYYQVAKAALMNWNGLSEQEAISKIENSTFEEIEGQVWAKGSMDYAIASLEKSLSLSDRDTERLTKEIYEGEDGKGILDAIMPELKRTGVNPNSLIMDTLFAVHDGWVKDNGTKFFAREKKHQHMPSELIGWKEAKADLLFIKPIFEAAGIEVNEEELEKEYNRRVKEFFLDKKITGPIDLVVLLSKGEKFYPALHGQVGIIACLEDNEFVIAKVIPQIEENGIGKIDEVREKILEDIIQNPKREDIERLVEVERTEVDTRLTEKLEAATQELEKEKKKNKLVEDILNKSKLLEKTNMEIEMEKNKKFGKNINNKEINEIITKKDDSDARDDFGE